MTGRAIDVVCRACRAWVRLHTLGLPHDLRQSRIAEIESDIWEFRNDSDARPSSAAAEFGARVMRGMLDDVAWRLEVASQPTVRAFVAATAVVAIATVIGLLSRAPGAPVALDGRPLALHGLALTVHANSPRVDATVRRSTDHASTEHRTSHRKRTQPDFSGLWVMDAARSMSPRLAHWDPRRIAGPNEVVQLTQSATSLREQVRDEQSRVRGAEYDLSGMVAVGRDGGDQMGQRSTWHGDRLVTVTTRITKGGAWSTIDVRSLSDDQSTMIVERVTETGHRLGTYVGREPDALRARVRDTFIRATAHSDALPFER